MKTKEQSKKTILIRNFGSTPEIDSLSDEELARWLCLVERSRYYL